MEKALHGPEEENLLSPLQVSLSRLAISGFSLLPFAVIALKKVSIRQFFWITLVGIFGNGLPSYLFPLAQENLGSGFAGMLNTLTPIFVFLISIVVYNVAVKRNQIIGLLLGLLGAMGLVFIEKGASGNFSYLSAFWIILATICYAISVTTMYHKLKDVKPLHVASLALIIVGIPSFLYGLSAGWISEIYSSGPLLEATGYVTILSVFGTAWALVLFNQLVQKTDSIFASTVTYIIPIFAAMWGIFHGERIGLFHLFFGAIIISGVYLVNKKKS